MKKALIAASFGTANPEAWQNLKMLEDALFQAVDCDACHRTFTSGIVTRKIRRQEAGDIPSPGELLRHLADEGYTHILCQPLQVIPGADFKRLRDELLPMLSLFQEVRLGMPLLSSEEDCRQTAGILSQNTNLLEKQAVIFMGHGTPHPENRMYAQLQKAMPSNFYVALLKGSPSLAEIREQLPPDIRSILLKPLMMVCGEHVLHHMAGEQEDSWKSILSQAGYRTMEDLIPLAGYPGIHQILIRHAKQAEVLHR